MRKTSITLMTFKILQKLRMVKGLLVLAPLRVIHTSWPNEVAKWEEFQHLSVGILHGKHKDETLLEKHDIYLCNYEGLPWLLSACSKLERLPFDMLVADESTKLKSWKGQRYNLLKPWLPFFKRRVILTGTPMANRLLDVFAQAYVMDKGATFGQYITQFRSTYFLPTDDGDWWPKEGTEQLIYDRLAPRVYYAHDEDWLKLPALIEKDIEVELPPEVRKVYDQMEAALRVEFEDGKVTAVNSGVATMKLRQIANGGVYLDEQEKTWKQLHDAKTEVVLDLLDELGGQPALITYEFRHDLERLKQALGKDTPHIGRGGVPAKQLNKLIAEWNAGKVPYVIVSAQSMAHGIDGFQEAGRAVIWHSLTYNYDDYEQLIRRLRRSGQRERVLVAHIIAKHTIDRAVLGTVRAKGRRQGNFFQALKEYWSE